jgi:DNA-binding response OmpR family regulator
MHALIIEDDGLIAMSIEEILRDCGFTSFDFAASLDAAVAKASTRCPSLITADVELAPGSGIDAVQTICAKSRIPVVFITGRGDAARLRMPQHPVLNKPFCVSDVEAAVRQVMQDQSSG